MVSIIPKKSLGQNFLQDQNISRKIVSALEIESGDKIIEIGPGTGALTKILLDNGASIHAIEIDERAIKVLTNEFPDKNLNIIHADILDFNLKSFANTIEANEKIKIIGNLPYYIASQILFYTFENAELIDIAILMLQKEVAQRLVSPIRKKDYGILTVATELSAKAKILFHVSPKCFYPEPKVWSSVVLFDYSESKVSRQEYSNIMKLVRAAFNQRRKTLKNSLRAFIENRTKLSINQYIEKLDENSKGIFKKRAEELTTDDFINFYKQISLYINDK